MKIFLIGLLLFAAPSFASLITPSGGVNAQSSLAAQQAQTLLNVQRITTVGFNSINLTATSSYAQIWNNPYGLSPTVAMAALGTNGCLAHLLLLSVSQLLNSAQAGSFALVEPCPVTCNSDGSASIGVCPSPSPSSGP